MSWEYPYSMTIHLESSPLFFLITIVFQIYRWARELKKG